MKLIIAIVIFFATLVIKLAVDYRLWLKGKPNQHSLGPIIVFACLVICTWLAGWRSAGMFLFGWWAGFDSFIALLMGQKFYYVGNTARLDKWQRINPALLWLKYAGAIVFTGLFISMKFGLLKK